MSARTVAAGRSGRSLRGPVVVALSLVAPVVLVAGGLAAEAAQPPGAYDAIQQTVSTLAGLGATDRWIMAAALALAGVIYVVMAVALPAIPRAARAVLGVGGVAVVVAALAAQPVHGSSSVHMTATVIGAVAFVLWPLPLAADRTLEPGLRRGSLAATVVMAGVLAWVCAQAWTDGTWLGAAERALLLSETVWPIRVATASWRREVGRPRLRPGWTTLALAAAAPVVFVLGLLTAQAAQQGLPDPFSQSLSGLAGHAATSRWIMSGTLVLVGVLMVLVAGGLRPRVPTAAWVLLGTGGVMLIVAALSPQPVGGYSAVHMVSAGLSWLASTLWPLGLATSPRVAPRLRWSSAAATAVLVVLVGWFSAQLLTEGTWYGISQRIVVVAQLVWPVVAAVALAAPARRETPSEREPAI